MRKIYAIQLSYDVSNEEKEQAEKALLCFEHSIKKLNIAMDYVDTMATPFKDHPDIDSKEVIQYRAALRRYRDKLIEYFSDFKVASARCIESMQMFLSDTQILKLIKLFDNSIEDIEVEVNKFSLLFNNLESKQFIQDVNKSFDSLKKMCAELKNVINERIEDHIKNNILGKNWVDGISDKIQLNIQRKTPMIIDLFKQRQEQLNQRASLDRKNREAK